MKPWIRVVLPVLFVPLSVGRASAEEATRHFTIAGDRLLLVNLIGEIRVEAAGGSQFEIDVALRGRDGGPSVAHFDQADGADAYLSIQFPVEKERAYVYPALGNGSTSFDPPQGCGWGEAARGSRSGLHLGSRQVKIRDHGKGLEAWADVTVRVPAGRKLEVRHGAGRITASGIQGDLSLDNCVGPLDVSSIQELALMPSREQLLATARK
jgi:hypothetical protein